MKQTKNIKRRNNLILLAVLSLLLVGCSSEAATEPIKSEPEAVVKEEAPKVEEVVAEVETIAEEVAEVETEIIPEPLVYEGIDMESDLPGLEWMETFKGIIDEPKLVVFNDSTNKKVIVENGAEVDFALDDTLAIYAPETMTIVERDIDTFRMVKYDTALTLSKVSGKYESGDTVTTVNVVEFRGETIELTATLNFQ